jgi:serine/threonine protein kinase
MTLASKSQRRRLEVGTVLCDRYEVQGFMGSGGFAIVYEGFDRVIERPVAIKVMHLLGDGPDAEEDQRGYDLRLKRFDREARAAARIAHPNVVTIFDLGRTAEERPFIVMERLVGHNLAMELDRHGGLTPQRALPLMCRVLEATGVGHRLGIVHRDIKPANLFLTSPGLPDENLRVLDFGLAHLGFDHARLTQTHQAAGTMGYLAPEYIQERKISPAMDVYQLCLVLVEMLTGQKVVTADNPLAAIVAHTEGKYTLPEWIRNGPLDPIVRRGLSLDPTARYPDAHALLADLAAVVPDQVRPPAATPLSGASVRPLPRDRSMDVTTPRPRPQPSTDAVQPVLRTTVSADPTRRVLRPELRRRQRSASPLVIGALGAFMLLASFIGAVLILTNWLVQDASAERLAAPVPAVSKPGPGAGAQASIVTVKVATVPAGAVVREGAIEHGVTPMNLSLAAASKAPIRLELTREGYLPMTVEVLPTDAPGISLELAREEEPDAGSTGADAADVAAAAAAEAAAEPDAGEPSPAPDVVSDPRKAKADKKAAASARKPKASTKAPRETPKAKKEEFIFGPTPDAAPARMVESGTKTKAKTKTTPARKSRTKLRMAQ